VGSLTRPQSKRPAKLRDEQIVVGEREGAPVAEGLNGRPAGVQPSSSQPAKAALVARVQSYLSLERC
jgi:hypothetical protein